VRAILLCAGYATRLRPLTDDLPKPLLPVGGRPLVDWILDRIAAVDDVGEVHVVTNSRFAPDFERWAAGRDVVVHDDGTTSNEDRLGAIGDLGLVLDRTGADDDLLVIAGDNLIGFDLRDYVRFWRGKGVASAIAVRDVGTKALASQYGVVDVEADDRVVGFVETPADPPSTLAAIAVYLYHREHAPLVGRYLAEGNPPDQPGNLVAWLHPREPVYAWRFDDEWFDIGDHEQLLEADNRLRRRAGLPERDRYELDPN
jgi:glucose-1-phosphate thymidylyltransferase